MTSCWFRRCLMMIINRDSIYSSRWRRRWIDKWWSSTDVHSSMEETVHQVTCLNILRQDCRRTVTSIIRSVTFTASSYIIYSGLLTSKSFLLGADSFSVIFWWENAYQYWAKSQVSTYAEKGGAFSFIGELSDRVGWSAKHAGSETATCTGTSGRRPKPCQRQTRQEWSEHLCLELFDRRKWQLVIACIADTALTDVSFAFWWSTLHLVPITRCCLGRRNKHILRSMTSACCESEVVGIFFFRQV